MHIYFTFWMIILQCLTGSKRWSKPSRSMAYGRMRASSLSVQIFTAPLNILTAAVGGSFFHSVTLPVTSLNFKNSSSPVATSVISTQSIIANSISSSNTGVQQNFDSVPWSVWQPLIRWKSLSEHAWTTFHCFKSKGDSFFIFLHHISSLMSSAGMQIDQHISFQPTARDFQVHKLYGPTENITVIARYHPNLQLKSSSLY